MSNKLVYYPSFSTGVIGTCLKNNLELFPGISCRFFSKVVPPEYYYPYFLITAGHNFKKKNYREIIGADNSSIIMGDSGGYQIASNKLKWNTSLVSDILCWLEDNSNIAMNLDIPTKYWAGNEFNSFMECLNLSYSNFKYFYENRKYKTKLLNILQGNNEGQINLWYEKVKVFDFDGWACGNVNSIDKMLLKLIILLKNGELEKENVHFIHFLGISKILDLILLSYIQNIINRKYNNRITISIDSSSPSISAAYGILYSYCDYKNLHINSLGLHNYEKYDLNAGMPCNCFLCKKIKFEDICKFDTISYVYTTYHNFYKFISFIDYCNTIAMADKKIVNQLTNNDVTALFSIIDKIFESDNPMEYYYNNMQIFNRIKNLYELHDGTNINKFIEE